MVTSTLRCWPQATSWRTRTAGNSRMILMMLLAFLFSFTSMKGLAQNNAANPDQWVNDDYPLTPNVTSTYVTGWINGAVNPQKAHFIEGYSINYRLALTKLVSATSLSGTDQTTLTNVYGLSGSTLTNIMTTWKKHTVTFSYEVKDGSKMALDFIMTYGSEDGYTLSPSIPYAGSVDFVPNLASHTLAFGHGPETVNPLDGLPAFTGPANQFTIPPPGDDAAALTDNGLTNRLRAIFTSLPAANKKISMFGGYIVSVSYKNETGVPSQADLTAANSRTYVTVEFAAPSGNNSQVLMAWGAHISRKQEWQKYAAGLDMITSGSISGSSYHTHINGLNGESIGNMDLQLSTATVFAPCLATVGLTPSPVSCNGGTNGSITAVGANGTAPYSYVITSGPTINTTGATSGVFTGLAAGVYTVKVTDGAACTNTATTTVSQPSALSATANGTSVACNGSSTGTASVTASGGTAPYTYAWSNGATTSAISGLTAGNYTVTVTDANSCTKTAAYSVSQPSALSASVTATAGNPTCEGNLTDGTVTLAIDASGGTPGYTYTYSWNNGATTSALSGLAAGTYSVVVTVTDQNGCQTTAGASTTLTAPECGRIITTYTQGYYGNANGQNCFITSGVNNATNLIKMALGMGGTMTIGTGANSVTFPATVADAIANGGTAPDNATVISNVATWINGAMPGGSTARQLPALGNVTLYYLAGNTLLPTWWRPSTNTATSLLTKQGKINNVLMSQTMVLTMNSRLNGSLLSTFPIRYNGGNDAYFYVQGILGNRCTSTTVSSCDVSKVTLPASVVNYLTQNGTQPATVSDLLDLANGLLGGSIVPNGTTIPSYSDVNAAVDAFNTGFDARAYWSGNYNTPLVNLNLPGQSTISTSATGSYDCTTFTPSVSYTGSFGSGYEYQIVRADNTVITSWTAATSSPISFTDATLAEDVTTNYTLYIRRANNPSCNTSSSFSVTPNCMITVARDMNVDLNEVKVSKIAVAAHPNPFADAVRFTIQTPKAGQAQLEVFNMLGQKVATIYNGYLQANSVQVVDFRAAAKAQQNLIYVLRINGEQVTGKLLNVKQ